MDHLTTEARSRLMGRIRGKDTRPEVAVRRLLFSLGYRYRLHVKGTPGRPDIAFPGRRKVIFVHGCFWHGHEGCPRAFKPKSRRDYWESKLDANRARDSVTIARLRAEGWASLVVWECEVRSNGLEQRLVSFLGAPKAQTN